MHTIRRDRNRIRSACTSAHADQSLYLSILLKWTGQSRIRLRRLNFRCRQTVETYCFLWRKSRDNCSGFFRKKQFTPNWKGKQKCPPGKGKHLKLTSSCWLLKISMSTLLQPSWRDVFHNSCLLNSSKVWNHCFSNSINWRKNRYCDFRLTKTDAPRWLVCHILALW